MRMNSRFTHFFVLVALVLQKTLETSTNGALISSADGKTSAYALNAIEPRGRLFLGPGVDTYPGMVIGQHARANDLEVNPVRAKKLTNMRAAGSDETIRLTPPLIMPLEEAITYVPDWEPRVPATALLVSSRSFRGGAWCCVCVVRVQVCWQR